MSVQIILLIFNIILVSPAMAGVLPQGGPFEWAVVFTAAAQGAGQMVMVSSLSLLPFSKPPRLNARTPFLYRHLAPDLHHRSSLTMTGDKLWLSRNQHCRPHRPIRRPRLRPLPLQTPVRPARRQAEPPTVVPRHLLGRHLFRRCHCHVFRHVDQSHFRARMQGGSAGNDDAQFGIRSGEELERRVEEGG